MFPVASWGVCPVTTQTHLAQVCPNTFGAGPGVFVLFGVGKGCAGCLDPVYGRDAFDSALTFFVVGDAMGADGTQVNFGGSRVTLNVSCKCNEEEYECWHVIQP